MGAVRVRYEIDPHNRLIIEEADRKTNLPKFRKVVDGRFKIDKNNELTYHIKAPVPRDVTIPHQVKLKGKWSLTKNHDLRLTLDKWARQTFGDELTLEADIIDVDRNALLFAVTTRTNEGKSSTYILRLAGAWQADKNNRLTFSAKREKGRHDILTFDGAWEINKNHKILYRYEKAHLIRKEKKIHTLIFKGYWDIKDKARLSYVIDRNTNSEFNFKSSLGIFRGDYIKYEVGIGLSNKSVRKTAALFGTWRIKKNVGLIFEVEYEGGKTRAIIFGAEAELTDRDTVSFRLRNDLNEDLSAGVELSHKILKGDGEAFIRGLRSKREAAIFAGAGWRW